MRRRMVRGVIRKMGNMIRTRRVLRRRMFQSKSSRKHHMLMKRVHHIEHEALHVFGEYEALNILS